jgi:hypothetical protein
MQGHGIRAVVGDRVSVELTPYDLRSRVANDHIGDVGIKGVHS